MKTLHLIRHAKSSWEDSLLSDPERPLKKRGRKDAALMASAIREAGWLDTAVFCSTAVRARQTIALIGDAQQQGDDSSVDAPVVYQDALYTFDYRDLMQWLRNRREPSVTIVGHNPALHELIEWLSGQWLDNFPTCGYCQLSIDSSEWSAITRGAGSIDAYVVPRMLKPD